MKTKKSLLLVLVLVLLSNAATWAQCAMCRGSVQSNMSTGRDVIGNGINTGILYLFVFPYLLVGVIAYLWYRNSKKNHMERQLVRERVREALGM